MAGQVRQPIDLGSLERWIDKNVPEIKTPLDLKQFGFGQSNPTYQITSRSTGQKYVMRKKPPGKLLSKTAHQVDREYRIIHSLEKTDVPVPKAFCLCEDDSVIGTAFYIMEFLDGRMVTDPVFPEVSPEDRTLMWKSAIQTLAAFHNVDYTSSTVNLSNFGRHSNFYDRQIKTFSTLSPHQGSTKDIETGIPVGPIPHFDEMVSFFKDTSRQPKDRSTLIHGDYKIDNMVFHKTEPRVIGVLDWEMATIGHPLSDIVNLTSPWTSSPQSNPHPNAQGLRAKPDPFAPGVTPGLPTLETAIKWYTEFSGYDVAKDLQWGNAFGTFRTSVIMQGIAARYAARQASGVTAKTYGEQMKPYGGYAWSNVVKIKELQDEEKAGKSKL